jgi:ureidoacrylate peracid hydrolase
LSLARPQAPADGLAAWIAPPRTALLIVDMQADFAAPDGAMARAGADLADVPAALATAGRLVAGARAVGAAVVFVGLATRPEADSPAWAERTRRRGGDPQAESEVCRAGARGAAFHGPKPRLGELVIAKTRYSAFFATDLDRALRERGLDTLVVCGLTTECCIDCTVRDAFQLDYQVFVARDACAAYDRDLHEGALKSLEINCAIVVDADEALAAWRQAPPGDG